MPGVSGQEEPMIQELMLISLIAFTPTILFAAEGNEAAADAFKQLTSLIGNWEGKFPDGRSHSVSYRLTAGGSVLVETWTLAPGRESMTLYHLDDNVLIATHYCPQGNQPRLQFVKGDEPNKLSFKFRDGTNLQVKNKSHQHAFWIRLLGNKSFERSETYIQNGSAPSAIEAISPGEAITYTRIDAPSGNR